MKNSKTKILATIGPATDSIECMEKLIECGVDAFRLNFSHGNKEYFEKVFYNIKEATNNSGQHIAILIDLQGPKIRVGELENESVNLEAGKEIIITTDNIKGNNEIISTSYKELPADAKKGNIILIDDGLLKLEVIDVDGNKVRCKILNGGILKPRKGMNLPGMKISTPALTEKDKSNLEVALQHHIDFVALSFVRSKDDIIELKNWLDEHNKNIPVIAKIEKPEAVENFDEILKESDGIMVARGDLGVEMNTQEVPIIQKRIIKQCNSYGKLVITATQMLESMVNNPVPTRAEASDVANAVFDGTDVVMLSAETSVGKFPFRAVQIMDDILYRTEEQTEFNQNIDFAIPEKTIDNLFDSTGRAIVDISQQVKAKAIVVFTHYGRKAKLIAKYRPDAQIFAFTDKKETLGNLNLYKGVFPHYLESIDDENKAISKAKDILKNICSVSPGDVMIFTAGAPITDKERRNWVHFEVI